MCFLYLFLYVNCLLIDSLEQYLNMKRRGSGSTPRVVKKKLFQSRPLLVVYAI